MRKLLSKIFTYVFLTIASFISVFPFVWMIIGATNSATDITLGKMSFGSELMNNFRIMNELADIGSAFWNSGVPN